MSLHKLFIILTLILTQSFLFSNCEEGTDVCLSMSGNNLDYESTADIAGFQFDHNGCVTGATGGDAAANGFTISASGTVVLAFSFTGSVIPAGEGTLVVLDGDITESCLSNFIFSDSTGGSLEVNFSVEPLPGCTDSDACNFDASANTDDGSCTYPEENYDCDGNCVVEIDCNGECGGSAVEDCFGACGGTAVEDECGVCDGDGSTCEYGCVDGVQVCLSLDGGNLNYTSTVDIAGFQFGHNGCVTGASGGDAEANGFTVSASESTVLAFSFTGSVVPAGSGTMVVLEGDVSLGCLSEFIFSDAGGEALIVDFPVVMIDGCTDSAACNYDMDANSDDGSCTYPEENYDCDGNCTAEVDCNGDCGGSAVEDECGICEGDGSLCTVGFSLSIDESTGNMLVHMSNAMDVAGFQFIVSNIIINSASGGSAEENGLTVSASPTTGVVLGFSFTGSVIPPGDGVLVELDYTALWDEACMSDVVLSDPVGGGIDFQIGDCIALDYTVVEGCMDSDACNYNSDANSDDGSCEYPASDDFNCDGTCGGVNESEEDCLGVCGGDAELDGCGLCGGDDSTCTGCMDDTALNYDSDATIECDNCCEYPTQVNIGVLNVSNNGDIEIEMSNISDVGGFQFDLLSTCDVTIIGAYGGISDDNGFSISTSEGSNIVLGFSFTGGVIPEGSGTLVFLETSFDCDEGIFGLENAIISDINGEAMTVTISNDFEYTSGCQDEAAANYGEEGDCFYNNFYNVVINHTGNSHLVIFSDSIEGLDTGDEIGLFDMNGVTQTVDFPETPIYGEVLVGAGVWDGVVNAEGTVTSVVGIMSNDLSDFNGPITNGAVEGNSVVVRIYDISEGIEYSTNLTFSMGGEYGDVFSAISGLVLEDGDLSNDDISLSGFELSQNYPNPFNPQTMIQFSVPSLSDVSVNIYDLNGKLIDVVAQGIYSQGTHSVVWSGMNLNNEAVSSGIYLYKLITPNETITKQLTLIR